MADAGELKAVISAETSDFIAKMSEIADAVQNAADQSSQRFDKMQESIDATGQKLNEASQEAGNFGHSLGEMAELAGFVVGLEQAVEMLKEFISESIEAASQVQFLSAALTSLTGSAEAANDILEEAAAISRTTTAAFLDLAQAGQQMAAFGISAEAIKVALEGVADWSEISGKSVGQLTNTLENVYLTGNLTTRTLKTLGLSLDDLAEVMGVSSDKVIAYIKAMGAESDTTMEIMALAMKNKGEKAANDLASTHEVAANRLKTAWHEFAVFMGNEFLPGLDKVAYGLEHMLAGAAATVVFMGNLAHPVQAATDALNEYATILGATGDASKLSADQQKAMSDQIKDTVANTTIASKAAKEYVSSISDLQKLQLIPTEAKGEIADYDKQAQKLFEDFERGFQGILEDWNQTAAGISPEKLLADLELLKAKYEQAGGAGHTAYTLIKDDAGNLQMVIDRFAGAGKGFVPVTDAIKMLDDLMVNQLSPDTTRVGQDIENANNKALESTNKLFAVINAQAAKPPLDPLVKSFTDLGIEGHKGVALVTQDITDLNAVINSHISTMGDMDAAWVKLTGDASKYAKDPDILPKIIDAQKQIVDQLTAQGAPLGDIYNKTEQILQEEINLATLRGQNASQYMIELENIRIKQQVLIDQSQQQGRVYTELMGDFTNAFGSLSKGIADNIVDAKNWGDVFTGIVKNIAKSILETLVGEAFKALEDALLKNTNLMQNLASGLASLFKSAPTGGVPSPGSGEAPQVPGLPSGQPGDFGGETGAAGGASSAAGGLSQSASSIMSGINVATGAITAVSSIISNFQMAHQTDILRSIELNTRLTAMFIGGLSDGGVQTWTNLTAQYTSKLLDLDGWIHDAWVQLLDSTSSMATDIHKGGGAGGAMNVIINISSSTNAQTIAQDVVTALKSISPSFSP